MNTERSNTMLTTPLFIMAVGLLLLNDFHLKYAYPGFITGKLSDVMGLFAFPLFLTFFFPEKKIWMYMITGMGFLIWKLPFTDGAISAANQFLPFTIGRTIDYSDYWTLLILPASYLYIPKPTSWGNHHFTKSVAVLIAGFAFCATTGTHGNIKTYSYDISTYKLHAYIDSTFARYPEIQIPSDDTHYEDLQFPYFRCYLVDDQGPEVFKVRFYGDEEDWKQQPNKSKIAITSVGKYQQQVKMEDTISDEERVRIVKKFELDFIKKLGDYVSPSSSD